MPKIDKETIKISVVSYINSLPFVYGLEKYKFTDNVILEKDIPSECARKLITNEVNIGLIPIASLPKLNNSHIISDYCIGAENKVDSVFLFSNVKLNDIKTIILDYQSNTSNNLTKILAKNFWNISPKWETEINEQAKLDTKTTAFVIIGDRTFALKNKYKFVYDLSEQWYNFTKLPFVFALWISNTHLPDSFISEFNNALELGMKNINKLKNNSDILNKEEFNNYLTKSIKYKLDIKKKKAIDLYLEFLSNL